MMATSDDDILNFLSVFSAVDSKDYTLHNKDYSDQDSKNPSPSTKGSLADCSSKEEAPNSHHYLEF